MIFSNLPVLTSLDLRGNRLVKFDLHLIRPQINLLNYIYLTENHWNCTELTHLLSYLLGKHVNYKDNKETTSNLLNVSGINCKHTIEIISKLEKDVYVDFIKNVTILEENMKNRFNKNISQLKTYYNEQITNLVENLQNSSKNFAKLQNNYKEEISKQAVDLQNSSKQIKLFENKYNEQIKQNTLFIVILAVMLILVVALCVAVVWLVKMYRRNSVNKSRAGVAESAVEIERAS